MKTNVGNVDRFVRIAVGLALVFGAVTGTIGVWGWVGLLPLASGTFRVCPAYLPFGFSTCKTRTR